MEDISHKLSFFENLILFIDFHLDRKFLLQYLIIDCKFRRREFHNLRQIKTSKNTQEYYLFMRIIPKIIERKVNVQTSYLI